MAEARGFVARHSLRLAYVSEAYLILGRSADALKAATRALELARAHGERANEAYSLRMIGEIYLHEGNLGDAKTLLTKSLVLAEELDMRPLEANCHEALASVLDLDEQKFEAERHRRISSSLVDDMEMRLWRQASAPMLMEDSQNRLRPANLAGEEIERISIGVADCERLKRLV